MVTCDSAVFSVKRRKDYQQWRNKEFGVQELGRHNYEDPVDLETWSKNSGAPVPKDCKIPFVHLPKSLPLSLKLNTCIMDSSFPSLVLDVTNDFTADFEIELPPKEMPEFIPEFFSIGKILMWASDR